MPNTEQIRAIFLPGGILSPNHQVGYFVNINNGIEAIDLNDGSVLWTTEVASYPLTSEWEWLGVQKMSSPLLATSEWLAVQKMLPNFGNAFKIAKIDPNGNLLWLSAPIVFPDWVCLQPSHYVRIPDLNFQVRATTDYLFLDWEAQGHYNGGVLEHAQNAQQKDNGTVRIDLNSGELEMLSSEDPLALITKDTSGEEHLHSGRWIAGQKIVDLVWGSIDGQLRVQLRICDRYGEQNIEKIIELGRGEALNCIATLDGCYIFVCPNVCADVDQPWWIFAAETGELLTTVNYDIGIQSIAIFNSKIYCLGGRSIDPLTHQSVLKVKDLNSGKLCWEYLVEPPKTPLPKRG
jgi:hypothetical protein